MENILNVHHLNGLVTYGTSFQMEYLWWLKRRNFLCTDMMRSLRLTVKFKRQITEHYVYSAILLLWEENHLWI